jgi:lipopolysaccharide transport system ATP-binding protein
MSNMIELRGVTLDYPIYSVQAKSLRNSVALAVGGKFMKSGSDVTVMRAISSVSFDVKRGDRVALVGHNGSGKTTLLKVLAGVYEPTAGHLAINGSVSSMLSMSIGLDMEASGLQNIRNLAAMKLVPKKETERKLPEIVEYSGLGPFINMPFRTYSAGMMARLTFSVATAFSADILIMDEWISAGDAEFMAKASDRMHGMFNDANVVVIASHSFDMVERICNKVALMESGRLVFFGPTEEWVALRNAS